MATWIIHLSDTHFALPGEDIQRPSVGSGLIGIRGFAPRMRARVLARIRKALISHHGARAAERALWQDLLDAVSQFSLALKGQPWALVHTGDVTQAGQIKSFQVAMERLRRCASGATSHVIPGNHDVWPGDFPAMDPSRTAVQSRHAREILGVPAYASHQSLADPIDLVLLDTSIPDSLLNSVALGRLVDETHGPQLRPRQGQALVLALQHHPPAELPSVANRDAWWRHAQQLMGMPTAMVLLDDARVRQELVRAGVAGVLCGHEHRAPLSLDNAIVENGTLLVMQSGCPTLESGFGNHDAPQFSAYCVEAGDDVITLHWFICYLHPFRWRHFGSVDRAGSVWRPSTRPPAAWPLAGYKSRAPFP